MRKNKQLVDLVCEWEFDGIAYFVHVANLFGKPVAVVVEAFGPVARHRRVVLKAFCELEVALKWAVLTDEERTGAAERVLSGSG